jgi:hypothetical protein
MNITKKPEINPNLLKTNPFVVNYAIPYRVISKEKLLSENVGVHNEHTGTIKERFKIDQTPFTKVFQDVGYRDVIMRYSENALRLFVWITFNLNSGEDYIWINHTLFLKKTDIIKKKDYEEALQELIRYGLLAYSPIADVYWVNPFIIFCGNRVIKYPNNLKEIE